MHVAPDRRGRNRHARHGDATEIEARRIEDRRHLLEYHGDEIGPRDDGRRREELVDGGHDPPFQSRLRQKPVGPADVAQARFDGKMVRVQETLQRDRIAGQRMALAHHAEIGVLEHRHLLETARHAGKYADGEIDLAVVEQRRQFVARTRVDLQADARRDAGDVLDQDGQQHDRGMIGHRNAERPVRIARLESRRFQCFLDLPHGRLHGSGDLERTRGRPHPVGGAQEKPVVEQQAQAVQCIGQRRLRHAEPFRGAADAAFHHHGIENHEELEIDVR